MTLGILHLGDCGNLVYAGHAGFYVSTVRAEKASCVGPMENQTENTMQNDMGAGKHRDSWSWACTKNTIFWIVATCTSNNVETIVIINIIILTIGSEGQ